MVRRTYFVDLQGSKVQECNLHEILMDKMKSWSTLGSSNIQPCQLCKLSFNISKIKGKKILQPFTFIGYWRMTSRNKVWLSDHKGHSEDIEERVYQVREVWISFRLSGLQDKLLRNSYKNFYSLLHVRRNCTALYVKMWHDLWQLQQIKFPEYKKKFQCMLQIKRTTCSQAQYIRKVVFESTYLV